MVYFLPTLSLLITLFLMVNLAIPYLLVLAVNFLPLMLSVIFLFLSAVLPFLSVALTVSFLADFLTVYLLVLRFWFTLIVFVMLCPLYVAVNL